MPSPRPILKVPPSPTLTATSPLPFLSSRVPVFDSPRVHFPPTPTMTQTEITHSSFTYDRKPIDVGPNACALPGRGERAMDSDLDLCAAVHRRKKSGKDGYFHPRAYEAIEVEGDQPEQASSLLFARDSSSLSSPYRIQGDTFHDRHARIQSHFRPMQTIGTLDAPDTSCEPSILGNFHLNGSIDACQFIQHIPHMDLSLPFIPPKQSSLRKKKQQVKEKEFSSSHKSLPTRTTPTTNNFERARKVVSNAGCGGFNSGFYDPGLQGCLGGF